MSYLDYAGQIDTRTKLQKAVEDASTQTVQTESRRDIDLQEESARAAAANAAVESRRVYEALMRDFVTPLIEEGRVGTDDVCIAEVLFYDGTCTPEEIGRTGPRLDIWSVAYDQVSRLLETPPLQGGDYAVNWVLMVRRWVRLGIWALGINPDFLFLATSYVEQTAYAEEYRTEQLEFQGDRWPRQRPLSNVVALWKKWQQAPVDKDLYATFAGVGAKIVNKSSGQMYPVDLEGPAAVSTTMVSGQAAMGLYFLAGKPQDKKEDEQWRNYLRLKGQPIGTMDGFEKIRPKEMSTIDKDWTVEQWISAFFAAYPSSQDLVEAKKGDSTVWVPGPLGIIQWMQAIGLEFTALNPTKAWLDATLGYMRNHIMFFLTHRGGEALTATELAEQAKQLQKQTVKNLAEASATYGSLFLTYIPVIGQIIGKILLIAGGWLQQKVFKRIVFGDGRYGCPQPLYIRTMADPTCSADLIASGGTVGQQAERIGATSKWLSDQVYGAVGAPLTKPPSSPWTNLATKIIVGTVGLIAGGAAVFYFTGRK